MTKKVEKRPKVFIGIPSHKVEILAGTKVAVQIAASKNLKIQDQTLGLSLLAKNFNELFCTAWKRDFDYFVLLHSDIMVCHPSHFSGGSWVDLLVKQANENGLAALSAVVPIKSQAGHTSTALQLSANNPYNMRRLTVRESNRLKQPFINRADLCSLFKVSEEKAGPLFINTGCLLMDLRNFDWAGCRWPGFEIDDKIVWDKNRNQPQTYTVPEDWKFSRWLDDQGWAYGATNELEIHHYGTVPFINRGDWGDEQDTALGQKSPEEYAEMCL